MVTLFHLFVGVHIIGGASGLVIFWVPVLARKGSANHKRWGLYFARAMILTGTAAIGMGLCSLIEPLATHPKLTDVALIRGLFGWMMLYLAILTIGLAWHGLTTIRSKTRHAENRSALNVGLHFIFSPAPPRGEFVMQHMQALLGAGISVYTAFLAFGAVRLMPSQAFNTTLWAVPSFIGISIMVYYRAKHVMQQMRQRAGQRKVA
jgi:hypothetical protein